MRGHGLACYRLIEEVGSRRTGAVYRAWDTKRGREVALEVLSQRWTTTPDRLARFAHDAKLVADLDHPNIVKFLSIERVENITFVTTEWIDGWKISAEIEPTGLTSRRLLNHAISLADALAAAHHHGVLHRDLALEHIMINRQGWVKVLDFGLGWLLQNVNFTSTTVSATRAFRDEDFLSGAIASISPEQAKGLGFDARSEIFSLGVILYEMATGRKPFMGDAPSSTVSSILPDTPHPVRMPNPTFQSRLQRILDLCLAKDPENRFQTMPDLRNALRETKAKLDAEDSGEGGAPPDAPSSNKGRWVKGWWGLLGMWTVAAFALASL